jgi:hypothetical protein
MLKLFLLVVLFFMLVNVNADFFKSFVPNELLDDNFFYALGMVESGNRDKVIGDNGKAFGRYQIWDIYVQDVNRISKLNYRHVEMFDEEVARFVTKVYLTHYGKRYQLITGNDITVEVLARIHNGGPNGFKNPNTIKYWEKFKKIYEK